MNFTLEELNPSNPVLRVNKKEIELSLLTLQLEVNLTDIYGTLSNAMENLGKNIVAVTWMFVIDKNRFDNSFDNFAAVLFSGDDSTASISKNMAACFYEAVRKSRPIIKNPERAKELQKMTEPNGELKICYAGYFDTVASRYSGYTLKTFYQLTLGQLHAFLNTIGDKKYEELEVQAALQGRKLKPRMIPLDVTVEEEKEQDQDAQDAVRRLREAYEKNNKGK